jgi:prolipoprotein diacylglyceryltransferase
MVFVGCVLLRLWSLAVPVSFVLGVYLILVGIGRFIEEHFRGEPQTAVIAGLRLYQWIAIGFVIGGAVLTTLRTDSPPPPSGLSMSALVMAVVTGALTHIAYGVDFPGSRRRFSRLR